MIIDFFVLACSYKHHNRCVAGIDLTNKRLIRLISRDESTDGAIKKEDCYYGDYDCLKALDVVRIRIGSKAPNKGAQTENYYVYPPFILSFVRIGTVSEIKPYLQKGHFDYLPFETKKSTMSFRTYNDRKYSISIIPARMIESYKIDEDGSDRWKVSFCVANDYGEIQKLDDYPCTDSNEKFYRRLFHVNEAYLVITMSSKPADNGLYYKFIASIIDLNNNQTPRRRYSNIEDLF